MQIRSSGYQKQINPDNPKSVGTVMSGSYTYVNEGVRYIVHWIADEKGFQPTIQEIPISEESK